MHRWEALTDVPSRSNQQHGCWRMRIAFDIDDTLIPRPGSIMRTETLHRLPRLISREPLREGAPELLKSLRREGHHVWLYTTSYRDPLRLHLWFASFGVVLNGIVNQRRHDLALATMPVISSKYPPAFGIDLLVDDSEGVYLEGQRYGFSVLRVFENDSSWCTRVKEHIEELHRRSSC